MSEKQFKAQVNYGWGLSLNMTGKAPAVAKRIFDTYADALAYANDVNDSAVEGLKLSVVADSDSTKNGVYFVQQIATPAIEADEENGIEAVEAKNAILVRFKFDDESSDTTAILEAAKEYTDSEIKELTEGIVKSNADAISILNGDDKTQGSVAKALTDAKAYIDSKVVNLDATVGSKEVTDGKHVAVEVVEVDGKLTTVTVTESDIASASVLAEVKKDVDNFFKDASFSENARDTLSELQEYINTDAQGALAMEQAIATNKAGIEAEVAMAREEESKLDQAITSEVNRAQDAELTLARDINTAFSQLNTIESTVATNKEVIENSLNSLDESITIKSGSGTNSSLQVNAPGSEASGTNSLAVGMDAVASGDYSVAMGRGCSATGRGSIALGGTITSIKLTGDKGVVRYSSTGINSIVAEYLPGFSLVKTSDLTIPVATITASEVIDNVVYITVDKTLSNSSALSNTTFGLIGNKASGGGSIALGASLLSSNYNSIAEGWMTVAAGSYSHAEGTYNIAKGESSHAEGSQNMAEGLRSHAEGVGTIASGLYSHTEGRRTITYGNAAHAEGSFTIASGYSTHAEGGGGHNIYLTGSNSTYQITYGSNIQNIFHFIKRCQGASILEITNYTKIATITSVNISDDGYTVTITTDTDLGELSNYKCSALVTIASGDYSHVENLAQSSGKSSHAGGWSLATNECSFSHGYDCVADGEISTSFGTNTYSQNNSEFALGRSNHSHTGETLAEQTLFSVGCGDFEEIDMSKRIEQQLPLPTPEDGTNALEIMQNGDIWLGGYEEGVKLFEGETKELNTYTKEELDVELNSKIESTKNELSTSIDSKAPLEGYAPNLKVRFSDGLVGRIETIPHEIGKIAPTAGISVDDNSATIERIKGESVVWNQLIDKPQVSGTILADRTYFIPISIVIKRGVYYIKCHIETNAIIDRGRFLISDGFTNTPTNYLTLTENILSGIIEFPVDGQAKLTIYYDSISENRLFTASTVIHNLTQMFGAGNEPTTIEEFEARKPLGVTNDYNEGTIVSFQGGDIKSVGFNAFDGSKAKVVGGQAYYLGGTYTSIGFTKEVDGELTSITIPSDKIYTPSEDGYIYAQGTNICIHLVHSGYRNGDYEPYVEDIRPLPNVKSIKDSNGDVLFPYGLLSAGSVCDEITTTKAIKRIGTARFEELNWKHTQSTFYVLPTGALNTYYETYAIIDKYPYVGTKSDWSISGDKICWWRGGAYGIAVKDSSYTDIASFIKGNEGVMLYYELAEPIEIDLEEPLNMTYDAWDFGTEELVVSEPSTSLKGEIIYHFNAVDRIRENSRNITTETERAKLAEETNSDAIAVEKARAEAKELELTNTITDETNARIASDKTITDTIGEVETGKTLVEMIKAAEAAAIAAATVVAENSEFITIEQTGEVGKTQTYTIKTQDIASIGDLAAEISRAQEAEQGNSDAINSIKSDYLKSSDKLELSQAIVSETEARIQAISNLEFKNSLKLDGVVQSEELLTTLSDVQSGALYSVGPDSNNQYKLYAYVNGSWTYMGYLNSSSIDITQSLGQSQNLAISQKAVTDALTPIIMTQAEFDALVSNGTITDDDLTIRYIID